MFKLESYRTRNAFVGRVVTAYISTVELPKIEGCPNYETCYFKGNTSEVVGEYDTLEAAVVGHYRLARRYKMNQIHIK